ncbi:deoxyribonuclease-1-like [Physella acuta]|uniref:deoxyribonuclease-1-like n=1 Tax=Physella acuta TaxID=109671 RepID=UPI0027DBF919|nr:deoxyribonuclease-1-like [Physella acuta]
MLPQASYIFTIMTVIAYSAEGATTNRQLKIAAYNIKSFGDAKMADVGSSIAAILSQFDVVLIQEVRDKDFSSLENLKSRLGSADWNYVSSIPLGRTTSYKEQYVFFYRISSISVLGTFQYNDTAQDVFEREPFGLYLQYYSAALSRGVKIILLGAHTQPTQAYQEIQALPVVMASAKTQYPVNSGVITMGDFNADCAYVSSTELSNLEVFTSPAYRSLIPHTADTTTATTTDCAYDRVVIQAGTDVIASNAGVYSSAWTPSQAALISDHYPVYFSLE